MGISLAALVLVSGCLSSSYALSEDELERLVETPPSERGDSLRVVQDVGWSDTPGSSEHWTEVDCASHPDCDACYEGGSGGHVHLHGHGHAHHHRVYMRGGRRVVLIRKPGPPSSGGGSAKGGGGGSASGGGASGGLNVGGQKELAVLAVAAAGIVTVGLVATEGSRYDGWINVHPDTLVHVEGRGGRVLSVPLSALSADDIADARRAVIVNVNGEEVEFEGRAPLDREGFTWRMELGTMQLAAPQLEGALFPSAWMAAGVFPTQELGILGFAALAGGTHEGGDVFGTRYGLEVQAIPIDLGRLHLGAYGVAGLAYEEMEGGPLESEIGQVWMYGGGLLGELDLTTRLGLTLRAGATWADRGDEGALEPAFMMSAGVSVY